MASDGKVARDATRSGDGAGPERVRDATIEVSGRLFAERGIHAVSVREIAREVGVSHTLLHLYFGSKDEIVRQVLSRYDHRFAEQLETASSADTAVADTFRSLAHDREFVRVLAAALVEGVVPGQAELEGQAQSALVRRIAQKAADQPQFDPRVVGALLGAIGIGWAVAGEWLSEASGFEQGEQEDVVDRIAALLQHMVGECL